MDSEYDVGKSQIDNEVGMGKTRIPEEIVNSQIPRGLIETVSNFDSFDKFETWFYRICRDAQAGVIKLTPEQSQNMIQMAYLFGFESKPDKGIEFSMASVLKDLALEENKKHAAYKLLLTNEKYNSESPYEVKEKIQNVLEDLFSDDPNIIIFGRVKKFGSLYNKLRILVGYFTNNTSYPELSPADILTKTKELHEKISGIGNIPDSQTSLDDLVGFYVIINDTKADSAVPSDLVREYSNKLVREFEKIDSESQIVQQIKAGRAKGSTSANIYIFGPLDHKDFGKLPIKIQIRTKSAMYQESIMYFNYKNFGIWELPPWASDIDFNNIGSFYNLQTQVFDNFKGYFSRSK